MPRARDDEEEKNRKANTEQGRDKKGSQAAKHAVPGGDRGDKDKSHAGFKTRWCVPKLVSASCIFVAILAHVWWRSAHGVSRHPSDSQPAVIHPEYKYPWGSSHYCKCNEMERASRLIESKGWLARQMNVLDPISASNLLSQTFNLTLALQGCVKDTWLARGAMHVDGEMLQRPEAWWNSILEFGIAVSTDSALQILNADGLSLAHIAVMSNQTWMLEQLISRHIVVDLHASKEFCSKTPLHLCAELDLSHAAKILVKAGASASSRDCKGRQPHLVASNKQLARSLRWWQTCPYQSSNPQCQEEEAMKADDSSFNEL
eukprot:748509-Hanusia_phi.AAC.3